MRRLLGACVALSCCLPALAQQSLNANVEQVGPAAFRISVTFPGVVSPDQAQAMLAEVGAHVCAGQSPVWGHYTFKTDEPLTGTRDAQASTEFQQELSCGEGVALVKPGTPAPTTPATDADRRAIEARTLEYLVKKDDGDFAAADAMFEDNVIAKFDRATWRNDRRVFNAAAGKPKARTIVAVTFYDDPADAPQLGRFAAADYRASFANQAAYCGYVIWLRQADGSYRLIREDESLITDEIARKLTAEQIASLKKQPGCREPEAAQ